MRRMIVLLVAIAFAFTLTGITPPDSYAGPVANTDIDAFEDGNDKDKPKDEKPKAEKKKRPQKRDYAKKLKSNVNRGPKAPPQKPKYKPWGKVLKDAESHDGLIKVWTKDEDVYFELSEENMEVPYLAISCISQGIGSNFVYGGLPVDEMMFDFKRDKDHVQMRRLSTNFRAPGDEGLENAIKLSFAESIVENFAIESERGKSVLIKVNSPFLTDMAGMNLWLGAVLQRPVRLDRKKVYFGEIKNFPENLEIDTRLTYSPASVMGLNLPNVPDPRSIQVGVQYSILKLPAEPMKPRYEDDRVGFFTTSHKDFTREKKESFFVHYANRWRLEKKDPNAAMSEPVKPIVYYLDPTIPDEYVQYIKEGVEWWQRAFEEAGFKNAIIAKRPDPEADKDYDAEDARYTTIRWNVNDQVSYGAIGPSRVDPRTGEIIDADILFEHNMVANFGKTFRRVASPRAALMEIDPMLVHLIGDEEEIAQANLINEIPQLKGKAHMFCNAAAQVQNAIGMQYLAMLANGLISAGEIDPTFVADALRWVTSHEVGHTIGLRHNFKSSSAVDYDRLNDKSYIADVGMTGSVMDYPSVNIALDSSKQGYYWGPTVGTYDRWAVRWGYSDVAGETADDEWPALLKIAAEAGKKEHLYGTDEDTYPMGAMDPRSHTSDLSDDNLAWAMERVAVCDQLLKGGQLESRIVEEGDNYVALRYAVQTLMMQKYIAHLKAIKYMGGYYTERPHKGDGSGNLPMTPVSAAKQMEALQFVTSNSMDVSNWLVPTDMLDKLMDDKQWSWQNNPFGLGRRFDFPLSGWVASIQNALIANMMNPMLQARIVETGYKMDRPFELSSLYSELTKTIWTQNTTPRGQTAGMQRNLQRVYVDTLIRQVVTPNPFLPQDAVALSRLNLQRIRNRANSALQRSGLGDTTNAHLMETVARIDRALDAQRYTAF